MRIVGPIEEIRAMVALTGLPVAVVACAAGIPFTRLQNGLGGFRPMTIDDMVAVRRACREIVAGLNAKANATTPAPAPATPPTDAEAAQ